MKQTSLVGGLIASLLFVGCAAPSAKYTNEAVAYALATEAELRALVAACDGVSGPASAAAREADQEWWRRNATMMQAADYGFITELNGFVDDRRTESLALFTMNAGFALDEQMRERVAGKLDTRNPERICLQELANFRAGDRDLNQDDRHYAELVALSTEARVDQNALRSSRTPTAANREFGRSFYQAEQALSAVGCQQADISMLKNSWPLEVYEAQCRDMTYHLVRCEWNRCNVY
ncbi:hypothetical protein ACFOSD_09645 [Salinispirillum marinum]|uniref:Lysozyme inhibitor LprI N-terminal domain-containing protein n=2 Tax=Saccharospirillaceae TaxID=255527 RepID=A0ABV8BE00_9GAMM